MPRNISPEEKLRAVKEYLAMGRGKKYYAEKLNVNKASFQQWLSKYLAYGETAFIRTGHNAVYTEDFKQEVVRAYLSGEGSLWELAEKYKIPSKQTISQWILKYNRHEKLKASGNGGRTAMSDGRKTTFEERVEIVEYCISHEHNYTETAEKYGVSYQQARSYTKKYEESGMEGLRDKRGRRKHPDEMNELERLKAENRLLRAEKEQAEMEADFLKKLAEIERKWG